MFCHKCGAQVAEGSDFCHMCGTKVAYEDITVKPQGDAGQNENNANEQTETVFLPDNVPEEKSSGSFSTLSDGKPQDKPKNKLRLNITGLKKDFSSMTTFGKFTTILGICSMLLVAVFLLYLIVCFVKMILSSVILIIIAALIVYLCVQQYIICINAEASCSKALKLPEGMDIISLFEALKGKFSFPYSKGVRYNKNETSIIIEGKYGEYPIAFDNKGCAVLDRKANIKGIEKINLLKRELMSREAAAVYSYINNFFDPNLSCDAVDDMKKLKFAEKKVKAMTFVCSAVPTVITVLSILYFLSPATFTPGIMVRGSYLPQYSDKVTVGEAFDNFFSNEKWSTYKDESYTYVAFKGVCEYIGEPADVRITFKITGENFHVDSLDINGVEQNDLILALMLEKIYEEY